MHWSHWLLGLWFLLAGTVSTADSTVCRNCHAEIYERWLQSNHYAATLPATPSSVLGDFSGASLQQAGTSWTFLRRGADYKVLEQRPDGSSQEHPIAYTFGVYPLQQYLIPLARGRLQAFTLAWDSRPAAQGGQRWFSLHPGEGVAAADPLHWTGTLFNWNSRCATCHSTGFRKHYDPVDDVYRSSWEQINVGCAACHGAAADHLEWARQPATSANNPAGTGVAVPLTGGGQWRLQQGEAVARPAGAPADPAMVEVCAPCHARRSLHVDPEPGQPLTQVARLALLEEGLYGADGRIQDEVYEYGSFLQSRMYQAGVVCSDCHDPHTTRLRAQGDALCGRCHSVATFGSKAHHGHTPGTAGSRCIDCHMPPSTYMQIDERRDHAFGIPSTELEGEAGIASACGGCHAAGTRQRPWSREHRQEHWARAFSAARGGRTGAVPRLYALLRDETLPDIVRATALLELRHYPLRQRSASLRLGLVSSSALVRLGGARSLGPPAEGSDWAALWRDPALPVRLASIERLIHLGVDLARFEADPAFKRTRSEYLTWLERDADLPEAQVELALYHRAKGNELRAEQAYRRALFLQPDYLPALLDLADLERGRRDEAAAGELLRRAVARHPGQAAAWHALGLLQVRTRDPEGALVALGKAHELSPTAGPYAFVYSVALREAGRLDQATGVALRALAFRPEDRELLLALAACYAASGDRRQLAAIEGRLAALGAP